jgi:hypothetical protein
MLLAVSYEVLYADLRWSKYILTDVSTEQALFCIYIYIYI